MSRPPCVLAGVAVLILGSCSFGDRSIRLRIDPPQGDPQTFRGISIVLEEPQDLRPEPRDVVGSVRSGIGVKTADITTGDDITRWIQKAMTLELQHAGFLVASGDRPGRALRIRTTIRSLACEEGIGFGAAMTLEIHVLGDTTSLLRRTYAAEDHHVRITPTSGGGPADSLRACLRTIVSTFVRDLSTLTDRPAD